MAEPSTQAQMLDALRAFKLEQEAEENKLRSVACWLFLSIIAGASLIAWIFG